MAWSDPANAPPVIVAVNAEIAVMDWIAKLAMGGAKHAFVTMDDITGLLDNASSAELVVVGDDI